jgi:hypothetical protein
MKEQFLFSLSVQNRFQYFLAQPIRTTSGVWLPAGTALPFNTTRNITYYSTEINQGSLFRRKVVSDPISSMQCEGKCA